MTMHRSIALIAALSLTLTAAAAGKQERIKVPRTSAPPKIDGTIDDEEWRSAARVSLRNNEGHALLIHDGNFLYIALVGGKPGIGSICARGRTGVRVLHASAALGTAAFEEEKGKWKMTRGFTWTNRDTGDSPEAMEERKKTLESERWFANTSKTAQTEREYQIPSGGQREVPLVIGFLTFTQQKQQFDYWPKTIEDDCGDSELASGFTDREFTFDPSQWGLAVLED